MADSFQSASRTRLSLALQKTQMTQKSKLETDNVQFNFEYITGFSQRIIFKIRWRGIKVP
jgi:hypothetical protein